MKSKRIIAVHLLNDWSGSPLVFRQSLEALQAAGYVVTLFTATPSGTGFLSNIAGISTEALQYRWHPAKVVTLVNYLVTQFRLFVRLLFLLRATDTVYINTLLPFGAALAGRLRGCRVVYHVHEVSIKPRILKMWLRGVANWTAQEALFVSDYTARQTALSRPASRLIYNALPDSFVKRAGEISSPNTVFPFTALMICSNKAYKGINEFVAVAQQLPHIRFMLVLNANQADVDVFVAQVQPPINCTVFAAQTDTISFYEKAHVVLNLSHRTAWVETFGLTILEGMLCGRPVLVPPVGGVRELIDDGVEGFVVDALNLPPVVDALRRLSSDITLYMRMAEAARSRAASFSGSAFRRQILAVFGPETAGATPAHELLADQLPLS
ncbi:glycosyltransferase family 4 protein [Fibrivirga algicola]|uniref:Glycosyltransferase family 4 protein n=1 Tax=Fibrivirga algicola TaxID=2950420 RepID=A0ABX0QF77_9BACT|nr:glycosyltransferase family 4 protein [Fibrivirga algicola]NID09891.1 glycosyltransferase family 4 protein [Fibrivirga algicola]